MIDRRPQQSLWFNCWFAIKRHLDNIRWKSADSETCEEGMCISRTATDLNSDMNIQISNRNSSQILSIQEYTYYLFKFQIKKYFSGNSEE